MNLGRLLVQVQSNRSIFEQPPMGRPPVADGYFLFICQLPHDETIKFHSKVGVESALEAVILYAEKNSVPLVVKAHPANPNSMKPLEEIARRSNHSIWIEDSSIHSCLKGASKVFLVNSGSGIEAMMHDKTIFRFGNAEYDSVVPLVEPNPDSIAEFDRYMHDSAAYADFIRAFAQNCFHIADKKSHAYSIELAISRLGGKSQTAPPHVIKLLGPPRIWTWPSWQKAFLYLVERQS